MNIKVKFKKFVPNPEHITATRLTTASHLEETYTGIVQSYIICKAADETGYAPPYDQPCAIVLVQNKLECVPINKIEVVA